MLAGVGLFFLARHRASAVLTLLEALDAPVVRPFAADVEAETTEIGGVDGLLYDGDGRAILVIPGATPAGLDDTRVRAVARSLSRGGRTVFIPELDLYDEQLTRADLERIVAAVEGLADFTEGPVTAVGFSYGGSFALIAAADSDARQHLSRVATLGAYYDLAGVVQAITTGGTLVDDEFIPWQGHPRAEAILIERTVELLPIDMRQPLQAALDGRLDPEELAPEARTLYEMVVNDDPHRTEELVTRSPPPVRSVIDDFSPASVADRIEVPVLAMHSTDDPVVPYGELIRLEQGMPEAETVTVEVFSHVDFDPANLGSWGPLLPDLWSIWGFTTWILHG